MFDLKQKSERDYNARNLETLAAFLKAADTESRTFSNDMRLIGIMLRDIADDCERASK